MRGGARARDRRKVDELLEFNRPAQLQPGERPFRFQREVGSTSALIGANALMYVMQLATQGRLTAMGCKPARAFRLYDWPRLLTPVFLHGSIGHLMVNSYSLQNIGPAVERSFGTARFLTTYLVSGAIGTAASFKYNIAARSVGASGAIFGLVGAYGAFLASNEAVLGERAAAAVSSLLQVMALNLATGLIPGSGVDNAGHAGGLVGGALAGLLIGPHLVLCRDPKWHGKSYAVDRSLWGRAVRRMENAEQARARISGRQSTPPKRVVPAGTIVPGAHGALSWPWAPRTHG